MRENPSSPTPPQGPTLLLPVELNRNISSSWVSSLLPHLHISGLVSLPGTTSQLLEIGISPLATYPPTHPFICLVSKSRYLSIHPCMYLTQLSIHLSLSVSLPTHPSTYMPLHPSIALSMIYQPRYLSIHPSLSISLSIHPSITYLSYRSRYLSLHPSTCLYYLGIYPSIIIYLPIHPPIHHVS